MNALTFVCLASYLSLVLASSSCRCPGRPGPKPASTGAANQNGTTQNEVTTGCADVQCNVPSDCQVHGPNPICNDGKCLCTFGFHVDPASCTCVRECTTYGDTYIQYDGFSLACFDNLPQIGVVDSPDTCRDACNNAALCISFTYNNPSGDCSIEACDSLDNIFNQASAIGELVFPNPSETLFVRNCAV